MSAGLALWIVLALLALARGLLVFLPSMAAWGLDAQRFLSPVVGWSLWALAALALFAPSLPRLGAALERLGDWIARGRRAPLVAAIGGAAVVWLLPDRVWFIGDFMIRMGNVESGLFARNYVGAMPLDPIVHSALLRPFGQGSIEAANASLRALGALEAGVLGALSVAFARALRLGGALALLAAVAAFLGGHLTVFTGLGKPAGEMCLAVVALAVFGIRAARDGSSLLPCGVVLALALGMHRSSVLLLPAWVVVLARWRGAAPKGAGKRTDNRIGIGLPLLVALVAVPTIVMIGFGYDVSHHVLTAETTREGGLLASAFSARHLLDLANLIVALSPLAVAIPVLALARGERTGDPAGRVLGTLALSFVPALLLIEPQQGIFRDWDVFAPAGVAFSLLAAWWIAARLPATPGRAWLAIAAIGCATSASLQWLALNHDAPRGLARVRAYLLEPPGPEPADRPLVWDFLTQRAMRLGAWKQAIDAAEHAAADAPHRRVFLMWALSATMAEDWPLAGRVYRRLLRLDPEDPLAWLGLAGIARRTGDRAALDQAMAKLRSYRPGGPEMEIIRRHLLYYPQVWPPPDSVEGWSPRPRGAGLPAPGGPG